MRGFEDKWSDIPDFMLGITEAIWEGRGLSAAMKECYDRDAILRTPGGISRGEAAAARTAMATLQEFPDRVLLGEDVIWSGSPGEGFLSSQRILSKATHLGGGVSMPATGRRVVWRTITDSYAKDNRVSDQWMISDHGGLLRQLGTTPEDWARARLSEGTAQRPLTPAGDVVGPYRGRGNDHPAGQRLADLLGRIMAADFSVIASGYDRACQLDLAGAVTGHGRDDAEGFWLPMRAALPDAAFTLHHVIGREDDGLPPRAAVRWSLSGIHAGWGVFGAPGGAELHVMGITHAEFGPNGIRREWTLYDEAAVWMQVIAGGG